MLGPWFWHCYAQGYDVLNALRPYQRMLDDVIDAAPIAPGMRLLDAGCGTGNFVRQAQARGINCRIIAVDACPAMLARARRKCLTATGGEFHLLDLNTPLPFAPASFDGIIGCNVLYAVRDAPLTLQRLAVLLKPGGRMVHTIPRYGYNMYRIIREHLREATWRERRGFLRLLPALLLVLACNLLLLCVYSISHPFIQRAGHRKLRARQLEEIRAYLQVEGCSLSIAKTYAEQNWLLCYEKKEAACPA